MAAISPLPLPDRQTDRQWDRQGNHLVHEVRCRLFRKVNCPVLTELSFFKKRSPTFVLIFFCLMRCLETWLDSILEGRPSLSDWLKHRNYGAWWWTCWQHSHSLNRAWPSWWPEWKAAEKRLLACSRQKISCCSEENDMWSHSWGRKDSHPAAHEMK